MTEFELVKQNLKKEVKELKTKVIKYLSKEQALSKYK